MAAPARVTFVCLGNVCLSPRDFDPDVPPGSDVPDPWYGGDDDFDLALGMIRAALPELVERLAR